MKRPPLTRREVERIVELRERRLSHGAIARLVGCSQGSVSWALLREGVDLHVMTPLPRVPTEPVIQRRGGHVVRRFTQADDAELAALSAAGLNPCRIAKRMGRRHNSIIGRMRTLGRREARAEVQGLA